MFPAYEQMLPGFLTFCSEQITKSTSGGTLKFSKGTHRKFLNNLIFSEISGIFGCIVRVRGEGLSARILNNVLGGTPVNLG